jgi:hypothetical protein
MWARLFLTAVAVSGALAARAADPDPAELLVRNSRAFAFDDASVSGPGWELLARATSSSQFVLLGEFHEDAQTPRFARALYRSLNRAHGFSRLALEQDPLAMQLACAPGRRGDVEAVAGLARRYPTLFEFTSDPDLAFIADACALGQGPEPVWGIEQALGATLYLEELEKLAPGPQARALATELLADARRVEATRAGYTKFLHDDPAVQGRLEALQRAFAASPGSRAGSLLSALVRSAEIFGYDRRAGAGEWVGLFNNTEREAEFKRNFVARYREASAGGAPPRVMFKFGAWHMYRGLSPSGAFPIANLAHELAIVEGRDAYGLLVLPGNAPWSEIDAWMKPLLPAARPTQPSLVDLRALRPYQRLFRVQVPERDQVQIRALINGFDAIVILPEGPEAERKLTGFPKLGG